MARQQAMANLFLQLWQYGRSVNHYRLLARTLRAAWRVRRTLAQHGFGSQFNSQPGLPLSVAIAAVEPLTLSPQNGWRGAQPDLILRFAAVVVSKPLTWGRCVQRSLIAYHLLNGYGYPARICFGIHRENHRLEGHAWVELWAAPKLALGEVNDPYERFLPVYQSAPPASHA